MVDNFVYILWFVYVSGNWDWVRIVIGLFLYYLSSIGYWIDGSICRCVSCMIISVIIWYAIWKLLGLDWLVHSCLLVLILGHKQCLIQKFLFTCDDMLSKLLVHYTFPAMITRFSPWLTEGQMFIIRLVGYI